MKKLLAPLSSLKLTVILIIAAMLLIYAGTWAQIDAGPQQVQKKYFHSFYTWVDFATLIPRSYHIPGGFPILGGDHAARSRRVDVTVDLANNSARLR